MQILVISWLKKFEYKKKSAKRFSNKDDEETAKWNQMERKKLKLPWREIKKVVINYAKFAFDKPEIWQAQHDVSIGWAYDRGGKREAREGKAKFSFPLNAILCVRENVWKENSQITLRGGERPTFEVAAVMIMLCCDGAMGN